MPPLHKEAPNSDAAHVSHLAVLAAQERPKIYACVSAESPTAPFPQLGESEFIIPGILPFTV